jgi:hypothetical protein
VHELAVDRVRLAGGGRDVLFGFVTARAVPLGVAVATGATAGGGLGAMVTHELKIVAQKRARYATAQVGALMAKETLPRRKLLVVSMASETPSHGREHCARCTFVHRAGMTADALPTDLDEREMRRMLERDGLRRGGDLLEPTRFGPDRIAGGLVTSDTLARRVRGALVRGSDSGVAAHATGTLRLGCGAARHGHEVSAVGEPSRRRALTAHGESERRREQQGKRQRNVRQRNGRSRAPDRSGVEGSSRTAHGFPQDASMRTRAKSCASKAA